MFRRLLAVIDNAATAAAAAATVHDFDANRPTSKTTVAPAATAVVISTRPEFPVIVPI
jgi:hypothetical protein